MRVYSSVVYGHSRTVYGAVWTKRINEHPHFDLVALPSTCQASVVVSFVPTTAQERKVQACIITTFSYSANDTTCPEPLPRSNTDRCKVFVDGNIAAIKQDVLCKQPVPLIAWPSKYRACQSWQRCDLTTWWCDDVNTVMTNNPSRSDIAKRTS